MRDYSHGRWITLLVLPASVPVLLTTSGKTDRQSRAASRPRLGRLHLRLGLRGRPTSGERDELRYRVSFQLCLDVSSVRVDSLAAQAQLLALDPGVSPSHL